MKTPPGTKMAGWHAILARQPDSTVTLYHAEYRAEPVFAQKASLAVLKRT